MATLRAVFMGSDLFSLPVLEKLLAVGPDLATPTQVIGVVTQPDRPAGRGRRMKASPVAELARERDLLLLQPPRVREPEAVDAILSLQADVVVVASFGQILPRALLETPPYKALNLHPSLLPLFRGPSPVSGAILAGAEETGTSLMLMSAKMDAGPILAQEATPIGRDETTGELTERMAEMSANLLPVNLTPWVRGEIEPVAQDEARATYTGFLDKQEALLDWTRPAVELARMIRAFNPWPVASTYWRGRQLRLLRATASAGAERPGKVAGMIDTALAIGTGEGLVLIEELQLAGGKALSAAAFVRGHPDILEATVSDTP